MHTGQPIGNLFFDSITKTQPEEPFLLSGSSIQNGQGQYLIIAVGENSENGRIQSLVRGNKIKLGGDDSGSGDEASGSKGTAHLHLFLHSYAHPHKLEQDFADPPTQITTNTPINSRRPF